MRPATASRAPRRSVSWRAILPSQCLSTVLASQACQVHGYRSAQLVRHDQQRHAVRAVGGLEKQQSFGTNVALARPPPPETAVDSGSRSCAAVAPGPNVRTPFSTLIPPSRATRTAAEARRSESSITLTLRSGSIPLSSEGSPSFATSTRQPSGANVSMSGSWPVGTVATVLPAGSRNGAWQAGISVAPESKTPVSSRPARAVTVLPAPSAGDPDNAAAQLNTVPTALQSRLVARPRWPPMGLGTLPYRRDIDVKIRPDFGPGRLCRRPLTPYPDNDQGTLPGTR